jgi:hypothetical protein
VSEELSPFTAYESPPVADADPEDGTPVREAPLRVPCIIGAFLGGGGLLTGLTALAGLFFGQSMQTAFAPTPGTGPQEMMQVQQQMQAALNAIQDRFFVMNLTLVVVHVCVAAFLLIASVRCLRMSPQGPRWMLAACWAAAGFEVARSLAQLPLQWQTLSATSFYVEVMFDSAGNVPNGVLEVSLLVTKVVLYVSLLLGFGWVLAKVLFYIYTARRLCKPEVQAAFRSQTSSS